MSRIASQVYVMAMAGFFLGGMCTCLFLLIVFDERKSCSRPQVSYKIQQQKDQK